MEYYDDSEFYGLNESYYSVEDVRKDLNRVVEYFKSQDYHEAAIKATLIDDRQLTPEIADECNAFFITEDTGVASLPDWILEENLGMVKYRKYVTFLGRLVYPLYDPNKNVMGFCGWEKFYEDLKVPKYLDSRNYGYKAKETTLYGMEKLEEYYNSKEPVYVVEGIVCCLYLRSQGFQALALLGSHMTPYVVQILKRFGKRLVVIPDNDGAGDGLVKQAKWTLKGCIIVQMAYGKDTDGCRKIEEHKYEQQLLKELRSLSNPFVKTNICIRR